MGKPEPFHGSKLRRAELHLRVALDLIAKATPVRSVDSRKPEFGVHSTLDGDFADLALPSTTAWQQLAIAAVQAGDYMSNNIVELRGDLHRPGSWELKINGAKPIKLDRRAFMVLSILASFALLGKKETSVAKRRFLPVATIVEVILKLTSEGTTLEGFWPSPSENDVHRTVHKLRSKLRQACDSTLVESGPRGAGYRISVPPMNLILCKPQEAIREVLLPLFKATRVGS